MGACIILPPQISENRKQLRWYACGNVPGDIDALLKPRKNQIGPYETIAILFGMDTFDAFLDNAEIILYVDNTEAQGIVTNGFAHSSDSAVLAGLVWTRVAEHGASLWVERVASKDNVADWPSRPNPTNLSYLSDLGFKEFPGGGRLRGDVCIELLKLE